MLLQSSSTARRSAQFKKLAELKIPEGKQLLFDLCPFSLYQNLDGVISLFVSQILFPNSVRASAQLSPKSSIQGHFPTDPILVRFPVIFNSNLFSVYPSHFLAVFSHFWSNFVTNFKHFIAKLNFVFGHGII